MIHEGHVDPLAYTPKRMYAFQDLARQRKLRESLHDLELMSLAAQGDPKAIRAQIAAFKKAIK